LSIRHGDRVTGADALVRETGGEAARPIVDLGQRVLLALPGVEDARGPPDRRVSEQRADRAP